MGTNIKTKGERVVKAAALAAIEGKGYGIATNGRLGDLNELERKAIAKTTGMQVEAFNSKLADRLGALAEAVADEIGENLATRSFKPGELAFLLSVLEDKRSKLDGRAALQNSQVNVQINNSGTQGKTREELLGGLTGEPVNVSADEVI